MVWTDVAGIDAARPCPFVMTHWCVPSEPVFELLMWVFGRLFPKSRWIQYVTAQINAIQSSLDMITHPQVR